MFRKIVSNLAFSPALIHEVGFYARRLRREEITRRLTVVFVVLTLVMQSLAVFSPPESANASSEQDIIRGGVSSLADFLIRYDHNEEDIKDIYTAAGITRSEIVKAEASSVTVNDDTYIMSRYGQLVPQDKEVSMTYPRSSGGMATRYFSPFSEINGSSKTLKGWVGKSESLGWFAIIQSNGALATNGIPPSISSATTSGKSLSSSISTKNLSQGNTAAHAEPGDKLSYTLKVFNPTGTSATAPLQVRVADLIDYSRLIDAGGGSFGNTDSTLSWPKIQLRPGETQERTFVVQLLQEIPATPAGTSDPSSFDCKLTVTFGNTLVSPVACPQIKGVESVFASLPPMSPLLNVIFGTVLFAVVTFFYVRTRQLKKEIRIIRHNFNTGIM